MAKINEGNRGTHRIMGETQSKKRALEDSMKKISEEHEQVANWKPELKNKLDSLINTVQDLKIKVEHSYQRKSLKTCRILIWSRLPRPSGLLQCGGTWSNRPQKEFLSPGFGY